MAFEYAPPLRVFRDTRPALLLVSATLATTAPFLSFFPRVGRLGRFGPVPYSHRRGNHRLRNLRNLCNEGDLRRSLSRQETGDDGDDEVEDSRRHSSHHNARNLRNLRRSLSCKETEDGGYNEIENDDRGSVSPLLDPARRTSTAATATTSTTTTTTATELPTLRYPTSSQGHHFDDENTSRCGIGDDGNAHGAAAGGAMGRMCGAEGKAGKIRGQGRGGAQDRGRPSAAGSHVDRRTESRGTGFWRCSRRERGAFGEAGIVEGCVVGVGGAAAAAVAAAAVAVTLVIAAGLVVTSPSTVSFGTPCGRVRERGSVGQVDHVLTAQVGGSEGLWVGECMGCVRMCNMLCMPCTVSKRQMINLLSMEYGASIAIVVYSSNHFGSQSTIRRKCVKTTVQLAEKRNHLKVVTGTHFFRPWGMVTIAEGMKLYNREINLLSCLVYVHNNETPFFL